LVNLAATDHNEMPVTGQNVTVKVEERTYAGYWSDSSFQTVAEQSVTTDAGGNAVVSFSAIGQGWYRITATLIEIRAAGTITIVSSYHFCSISLIMRLAIRLS